MSAEAFVRGEIEWLTPFLPQHFQSQIFSQVLIRHRFVRRSFSQSRPRPSLSLQSMYDTLYDSDANSVLRG